MKKALLTLLLLSSGNVFASGSFPVSGQDNDEAASTPLAVLRHPDPKDRPESLKQSIIKTAESLRTSGIRWTYNGSSDYGFMNVSAREMIVSLIQAYPDQKEFYIADLGAGNFSFNEHMADFFRSNPNIPSDVSLHFIGLTGENYPSYPVVRTEGQCTLYALDGFAIENMDMEWNLRHFDFKGKVDLILSSYMLIHLHDPVGTLVQAYDLLKPGQGLAMFDAFPVYFQGGRFAPEGGGNILNLADLFLKGNAPFLITNTQQDRSNVGNILLRRPDDAPLSFAIRYDQPVQTDISGTESKDVASFQKIDGRRRDLNMSLLNAPNATFFGDWALFDWLYQNHRALQTENYAWQPIDVSTAEGAQREIQKRIPPLFQAVRQKDMAAIQTLLADGGDVNQKNAVGDPLIFTAFHKKVQQFLINQDGFDPNATDRHGNSLLHGWLNPEVIKTLLTKNPNVNAIDRQGNTPLHKIKAHWGRRPQKALEIWHLLMNAGADPRIANHQGKTPSQPRSEEE